MRTSGDPGGDSSADLLGSIVDELGALAVAAEDDPRVGALARSLVHSQQSVASLLSGHGTYPGGEIGHGPAASAITSGEETEHVGRVVHTLDGQVGGTDLLSKGIEEDGADGRRVTDVAVLRGAPGIYEGDPAAGCAVDELVRGGRGVLPRLDGRLEVFGLGELGLVVRLELGKREGLVSNRERLKLDGSRESATSRGESDQNLSELHLWR